MARFLPKSLLGQMLLAVGLALLVAQGISGVLLYRGDQERREARVVNTLAFQLVAGPRGDRLGERRGPRRVERRMRRGDFAERRRNRIAGFIANNAINRAPEIEAALRDVLITQDIAIAELVVLRQPIDAPLLRGGRVRPVPPAIRAGRRDDETLLVAGLRREGSENWQLARTGLQPRNPYSIILLLVQTLVLYIVLVGGLALLLRRITRPLATLAERTNSFSGSFSGSFAGTQGPREPLQPSGPADMQRLIAAHNAMERRIAALIDEKDVMLGAIGHDLKTPLTALRVRIESVSDEAEKARMAASIEDITRSLDDILSLARVGRPSDPLERTELSALVASVVEEYEDLGDDVALIASERIAIPLRATWLRRALRNLVSNALRYGHEARISVLREGDEAVVRITDKGPGIPENQISAMLEPFTRGETSRNRETGGAGLGLTLARAIAEQHGGTLVLANIIGADEAIAGLQAELRLPTAQVAQ